MDIAAQIQGRLVSAKEIATSDRQIRDLGMNQLQIFPAIQQDGKQLTCQRCGNQRHFMENICNCSQDCFYCLQCLAFGKLRTCDFLYHLPADGQNYTWARKSTYLTWSGQLSAQQAQASMEICQSYQDHVDKHLVWAVTGAGKTEMVFQAIDIALCAGKKVAVATPRIDVANELAPRFQAAFPNISIQVLHGQSEQTYDPNRPMTVCSTHQLIRFRQAFDLLIIDEIDAFPYDGDPMLYRASQVAVTEIGTQVLLTATPNTNQMAAIQQKQVAVSILPARYHRHHLPVPKHVWVGDWRESVQKGKVPTVLKRTLLSLLSLKRRVLIFVPNIDYMLQLVKACRGIFYNYQFESVSSKDPDRITKVQAMREGQYDFLFSTTILERGVTFAAIDVIVLGSEDRTFTTASLVQIAGRVGRKPDFPDGSIYFLHYGKTKASKAAIQQIQEMNRQARERGLIDD
ncbi:DNA/RNA helicase [Aerococcus agrisoli]|uniref:DNA/RNA helicase n=1 Tax=Aerococcus agrisoli TaxID=2487350 RepID=A0A3N4GR81_9LACT|nr:DEAD/DEAH box helicase family protein [Aerococcus agrisoli]RPA65469.1 DNA/RNA helicase [Aerococcus agrisoli]